MAVTGVGNSIAANAAAYQNSGTGAKQTGSASFSDILSNAMGEVISSDFVDKSSNLGLMVGETEDAHSLTIAAEKADITLQLTMQVRNKMIEAYQEIMRMQI